MPDLGDWLLLRYATYGPIIYHERLIIAVAADGLTASILTPDGDHYVEDITTASASIHTVLTIAGQGERPAAIPAHQIYGFRALPDEHELAGFFASGASLTGASWPTPPFEHRLSANNAGGRAAGEALGCQRLARDA